MVSSVPAEDPALPNTPPRSLEDVRALLADLPGPDGPSVAAVREREGQLTKPPGALGKLESLTAWLAAWQGASPPKLDHVAVRVFAGNHGIAPDVSAFPPEVTAQMVANFEAGGAAVNQLCQVMNADLQVIALNLDRPTNDFRKSAAMTEVQMIDAFVQGMASVPSDADLLCLGEMGIGNTAVAAALCLALYGGTAKDWVGPGTGVKGAQLDAKAEAVHAGAVLHARGLALRGLDILTALGGFELAALAGAILQARKGRVPVLLDGYVVGAAAACLHQEAPTALYHCQAAHVSAEPGHRRLLQEIGLSPLLDMNMRLGEASGAVLAVGLLRAAQACHTGMATFADAGVTDQDKPKSQD